MNKLGAKILVALAVVALAIGVVVLRKRPRAPRIEVAAEQWAIPSDDEEPRLGPEDAPVVLVEFGAFDDGACARMAPIVRGLVERRFKGELALVWRDRPEVATRPKGVVGALVARRVFEAQGNDGFWKLHATLFGVLSNLPEPYEDELLKLVPGLPSDHEARNEAQEHVGESLALAVSLGVHFVPQFFINGRRVSGLPTEEDLVRLIEEELARAKQLTRVPRARVHEELTKKGKQPPEVSLAPGNEEEEEREEQERRERKRGHERERDEEHESAPAGSAPVAQQAAPPATPSATSSSLPGGLTAAEVSLLRARGWDPEKFVVQRDAIVAQEKLEKAAWQQRERLRQMRPAGPMPSAM